MGNVTARGKKCLKGHIYLGKPRNLGVNLFFVY
jgi:hypothetical protein